MLWLEKGDQLPTVAWLQDALNSDPKLDVKLTVDGGYGRKTRECVREFQKRRHLSADGVAGPKTSDEILGLTDHQIVNFVDDSDTVWRRSKKLSFGQHALRCIMKMGGDFILSIPNQDGMELILNGLAKRGAVGKVALLRIYSHGKTASQNLTRGLGGYWDEQGGRWNYEKMQFVGARRVPVSFAKDGGEALHDKNMWDAQKFITKLSKYFAPLGSLELHGCEIAKGKAGQSFVARLALIGHFPVTAAMPKNYTSANQPRHTLRLSKPTFSFYPMGMDLKSWAKSKVHPPALAK